MAGPWAMERVPRATLRAETPSTSHSIPRSKGRTSAWAALAILHTLEAPCASWAATFAVTSGPVCVTPSATTPLSAHSTATQRGSMATSALPWMPAMRSTMRSSSPRLPRGFATLAQRLCAACIAPSSGAAMPSMTCESSMHIRPNAVPVICRAQLYGPSWGRFVCWSWPPGNFPKKELASSREPLLSSFLALRGVASMAQLVEHRSRKAGVIGSNPIAGSMKKRRSSGKNSVACFLFLKAV